MQGVSGSTCKLDFDSELRVHAREAPDGRSRLPLRLGFIPSTGTHPSWKTFARRSPPIPPAHNSMAVGGDASVTAETFERTAIFARVIAIRPR
jgi:hypothetical protein